MVTHSLDFSGWLINLTSSETQNSFLVQPTFSDFQPLCKETMDIAGWLWEGVACRAARRRDCGNIQRHMLHGSPESLTAVKLLLCVRWLVPTCHSWQLASAWLLRMDFLPCRKKIESKSEYWCRGFKVVIFWSESNPSDWGFVSFVSCVRSLTLGKEPWQSHWLKKPVVKRR